MTLEAIKEATTELPAPDNTTLISWLAAQNSEAWDKQLEGDFSDGGAGMALLARWNSEIKSGESIPLQEFFKERNVEGVS